MEDFLKHTCLFILDWNQPKINNIACMFWKIMSLLKKYWNWFYSSQDEWWWDCMYQTNKYNLGGKSIPYSYPHQIDVSINLLTRYLQRGRKIILVRIFVSPWEGLLSLQSEIIVQGIYLKILWSINLIKSITSIAYPTRTMILTSLTLSTIILTYKSTRCSNTCEVQCVNVRKDKGCWIVFSLNKIKYERET